jgi:curved DNA-binding protein CbpA
VPSVTSSDPRHTYYKMLMLAEIADGEVISTVYRKLAQRYHPDVDPSPEAARRMAEINEAYGTLRDPEKRATYDAWLASRRDRRQGDRLIRRQGDVPYGDAGVPVGPAQGSVVDFGRYMGWTLGQIKRADPEFLEWLARVPAGRQYREEIGTILGRRA